MYSSVYLHRIPHAQKDGILAIMKEASRLYQEHGATGCVLLQPAN